MLNVNFENSEDLLKVLRVAESILSVNKVENKLKFIKLENINNSLQITARNPFMRLEYLVDGVSSIEGDAALYDYRTLSSLLSVINGKVQINDGAIKGAKCSYRIPCTNKEGYPEDILPNIENYTKLDGSLFKQAIDNVGLAAAKNTDDVMSGVYIGVNKIVASDSKRIFIQELQLACSDIILPKEFYNEVPRLPFGEEVFLAEFGENIIVRDGKITLVCAKLAKKYPKFEQILPKSVKNEVSIDRDDMYNALIMVAPVIDEATRECCLEYCNDNMLITVNNGVDTAKTNISVKIKNPVSESIKVKFNIQFLLDMLKINSGIVNMVTYNENIGYMFICGSAKQFIMPMIN